MKPLRNPLLSLPLSLVAGSVAVSFISKTSPAPVLGLLLVFLLTVIACHLLLWLPVILPWSCRQRFSLRALMIFVMLIAFYLGGVKSGGMWQDLVSDHLHHRAVSSGHHLYSLDVYAMQRFSVGDVVDVEVHRGPLSKPHLVLKRATLIRSPATRGRSHVLLAVSSEQGLQLESIGGGGNRYTMAKPKTLD